MGLAVEHPGHVHLYVPRDYGAPSHFAGEYRVLQPDGSLVTYRPGHEGYFDQVLLELSRVFAVGKQEAQAEPLDWQALYRLFTTEVLERQRRLVEGEYDATGRTSRRDGHNRHERPPSYRPREDRRGQPVRRPVPLIAA